MSNGADLHASKLTSMHHKRPSMTMPIPYGWFALAYSSDLAPGDVQPLHRFNEELVLFRTDDGKACAMEAYCPHLGAHLGHGGKVQGDAIQCPFHGWEFDGRGQCVKIPYASRMPRRAASGPCLYSYPVQERNQMIWAWYHPRRIAPLWDIEDVPELSDPDWTPIDRYEWEVETPIQEAGENAVDIAHFVTVHGAQAMPRATISTDGHCRETRLVCPIPAIDDEGNMDFTRLEDIHLLTRSCGPGLTIQNFSMQWKTTLLGAVTPITATRMKLYFAFTKRRDLTPQFNFLVDAMTAEIVRQVQQDIPIWENKRFHASPLLCDGDGPIAKYRKWFAQFYDNADAPAAARSVKPEHPSPGLATANR